MSYKPNMKVLIVDDMSTMRKIIKNMLTQLGFKNIIEAEDGRKAIEAIESAHKLGEPVEFILSDWNMPDVNGLEFLKLIKANDAHKNIPFLMITAEAEQGNVMTAVKAGVDNFIVKPFSAQVLKEKIDKIFAKRAAAA
ncbi:MAG: response regulator [Oligoflexia bacterium]|nr:response regulator [Oligoflexia bacterium]MBF0366052.1 response regulator [Oligoflexia bacterium]